MQNLFGIARCCCGECENCCGGTYPSEFDVTVNLRGMVDDAEFGDGICDRCENFGGTFTLQHARECTWRYDSTPVLSEVCVLDDPYDMPIIQREVTLDIYCASPTTYGIWVGFKIWREAAICPGHSPYRYDFDEYWFNRFIAIADFACSSATSFHVPRIAPIDLGVFFRRWIDCDKTPGFLGAYGDGWSSPLTSAIALYCEHYDDAIITAVP